MTGYGRGEASSGELSVFVELRTVNHRFLDVKLRGAPMDPALEELATNRIRNALKRGSVNATLRISGDQSAPVLKVNPLAAKRAHSALAEVARMLSLEEEVPLALVCQQPGVLVALDPRDASIQNDGTAPAELSACLATAMDEGLGKLVAMRKVEGDKLSADLDARFETIAHLATQLAEHSKTGPEDAHKRLSARLEKLRSKVDVAVDDTRLAQEVAILVDRMDVTEELVRIESHLEQCRSLFSADTPVGRRFDFLVQELSREFNTVGSKSQSAGIANTIVEAKAQLEKIREQVQNIE